MVGCEIIVARMLLTCYLQGPLWSAAFRPSSPYCIGAFFRLEPIPTQPIFGACIHVLWPAEKLLGFRFFKIRAKTTGHPIRRRCFFLFSVLAFSGWFQWPPALEEKAGGRRLARRQWRGRVGKNSWWAAAAVTRRAGLGRKGWAGSGAPAADGRGGGGGGGGVRKRGWKTSGGGRRWCWWALMGLMEATQEPRGLCVGPNKPKIRDSHKHFRIRYEFSIKNKP